MQVHRQLELEVSKLRDVVKQQNATIAAREAALAAHQKHIQVLEKRGQELEQEMQEATSQLALKDQTTADLEKAKKAKPCLSEACCYWLPPAYACSSYLPSA